MPPIPRLRPMDIRPFTQNGQDLLLLRDPLALSTDSVIVPRVAAPVLALCDGTRDVRGLQASLLVQFGLRASLDALNELIEALDQVYLLDNDRAAQAKARALAEYRRAVFRAPALAGGGYPADAAGVVSMLDGYIAEAGNGHAKAAKAAEARGLVTPHIDYQRGGPVYAAVWQQAADAARDADLAIIFGTDHSGGEGRLTPTRQSYATPFGVLPTAVDIVDRCASALGGGAEAYAEELHHRNEHSIELASVWLHYVRGGKPVEVVPVLCGSFAGFVRGDADPAADRRIAGLVETLKEATAARQTVVIAAADLAHIGPAFGGEPVDEPGRTRLQAADEELLSHMAEGDAGGFFGALKQVGDSNNVCGLPPIYLALRLLAPVQGEPTSYDHCPADDAGTSLVSVAGLVWR
jgi:MEMO1 family protein